MTRRKLQTLVRAEADNAVRLLERKGKDYDEGNDVLARLRDDAKDLGITAEQCVLVHLKKHLAAIERWARDGELLTQPPEERIRDAMAYLFLGLALIEEGPR